MPDLPSGTVTFLFTDIESSTERWAQDRTAMADAVERHLIPLRQAIATHGGVLFKVVGDAVQAAFPTAPQGVAAALTAQRTLLVEDWGPLGPIRVRIALHAGEAEPDERGDYLAPGLNRLSQLLSTGYGGQVLLSHAIQQLARDALPECCSLRNLGEHRLRDLLAPERVFQLLHPDLPGDFPPLRSLGARPHNLPRQPTPFLGREREVEEVVQMLRDDQVRLLTLTGTGGSGKTRLALQAAAEALDAFPDGVSVVPLASLTDPALIPSAVAQALEVPEQGGDLWSRFCATTWRGSSSFWFSTIASICWRLWPTWSRTCSPPVRPGPYSPPAGRLSGCALNESGWYRPWHCPGDRHHHPLPSSSPLTPPSASSSNGRRRCGQP